jgi:hypothetical protein
MTSVGLVPGFNNTLVMPGLVPGIHVFLEHVRMLTVLDAGVE